MTFLSWFGNTALITYEGRPKHVVTYEELGMVKGPARFCVLFKRRCFPAKELNAFVTLAEARGLPEALTWFHANLGLLVPEESRLRRMRAHAMQGMRYPKWADEKYKNMGSSSTEASPDQAERARTPTGRSSCSVCGGPDIPGHILKTDSNIANVGEPRGSTGASPPEDPAPWGGYLEEAGRGQ